MGHNGAGKTTLINTLCGLVNLSSGNAKIYSTELTDDLNSIRIIRNVFAHTRRPLTFNTEQIADECHNLLCLKHLSLTTHNSPYRPPDTPRKKFILACFEYKAALDLIKVEEFGQVDFYMPPIKLD